LTHSLLTFQWLILRPSAPSKTTSGTAARRQCYKTFTAAIYGFSY